MNRKNLLPLLFIVAISICGANSFASSFFYPKNSLLNSSVSDSTKTKQNWPKLNGLMNRIRGEYSATYQGYNFNVQNIQLLLLNDQATEYNADIQIKSKPSLSVNYGFYINKRWYVAYGLNSRLGKTVLNKNNQIMLGYNGELSKFKKPIYIEPYLSYFFSKSGYLLGTYSGATNNNFGNVPLIANKSLLYVGEKQQGISLGIGFRADISSFLSLMFGGAYYFEFQNSPGLFYANKHMFYTRTGFSSFNNQISYQEDGVIKTMSSFKLYPWQVKFGFMFSL